MPCGKGRSLHPRIFAGRVQWLAGDNFQQSAQMLALKIATQAPAEIGVLCEIEVQTLTQRRPSGSFIMWPRKRANRASRSGFTQTTRRASADRPRLAHRQPGAHSSPVKLRADLPNTRIARVGDDSEVRAGDIPARIHKLRVVEYVEKFDTEVKSKILFNLGPLQEPK